MFRKLLDEGQAGDNIGALLRGTKKEEVERGQVLCKPGSITPHTEFEGQVYVLTKEEGGRHKPFFANYRPQFYFRTTDVTGHIELPEGTEMCMPGDNTLMKVTLIPPSPWTKASASPSAKAAAPSAPAESPRSSSSEARRARTPYGMRGGLPGHLAPPGARRGEAAVRAPVPADRQGARWNASRRTPAARRRVLAAPRRAIRQVDDHGRRCRRGGWRGLGTPIARWRNTQPRLLGQLDQVQSRAGLPSRVTQPCGPGCTVMICQPSAVSELQTGFAGLSRLHRLVMGVLHRTGGRLAEPQLGDQRSSPRRGTQHQLICGPYQHDKRGKGQFGEVSCVGRGPTVVATSQMVTWLSYLRLRPGFVPQLQAGGHVVGSVLEICVDESTSENPVRRLRRRWDEARPFLATSRPRLVVLSVASVCVGLPGGRHAAAARAVGPCDLLRRDRGRRRSRSPSAAVRLSVGSLLLDQPGARRIALCPAVPHGFPSRRHQCEGASEGEARPVRCIPRGLLGRAIPRPGGRACRRFWEARSIGATTAVLILADAGGAGFNFLALMLSAVVLNPIAAGSVPCCHPGQPVARRS